MHELNYIHRDIKLNNIIMNEKGIIKLIDFGKIKIYRFCC
jgi:serine/threonine protein kinase